MTRNTTTDLVRTHVVVGQPEQVRAALARAQADGRLVDVRDVAQLPDRQVQVTAELREPSRSRSLRGWTFRWPTARGWLALAAGAAVAAVVVGVVWVVVAFVIAAIGLINTVAGWIAAYWPALVGAAVVLLVATTWTGGTGRCGGLHCGGCRRH